MKRKRMRAMSVFLTVLLVVQLFTMYAGAEETVPDEELASSWSTAEIPDEDRTKDALILGEVDSLREKSVEHYRMEDGTFLAIDYSVPMHFKAEDGSWKKIDNTLKEEGEEYRSVNGKVEKSFAKNLSEKMPVSLKIGESSISMAPVTDLSAEAVVDNSGAEDPFEKGSISLDTLADTVFSESSVRYDNVFPSASLIYENHGYDLKETILVPERQENYSYAFRLDCKGMKPELQKDGSIQLTNEEKKEIASIPAPVMEDEKGEISSDASYQLQPDGDAYMLTITADPAWMNDPSRTFPVRIDPTLYLHNNGGIHTTMLRSGSPDSAAPNHADQYCGVINNSSYQNCEVVLQAEAMPQIPVNCVMVNASVMMAHAGFFTSGFTSTSSGEVLIKARQLNAPASNVNSLTYNGVHGPSGLGVSDIVLDYQKLSASTRNKYVSWDVTSAALGWLDSGAGKGAVLLSAHGDSVNRFANLIGHAWQDNSPYFAVQYRNVVGLEDYYTYQEDAADAAGSIAINEFTHKLTLSHEDVSLNLDSQSVEVTHHYNSSECTFDFTNNESAGINTKDFSTMKLGKGWKLSAQQTVVEKTIGKDPYLIYTDDDGTEHYFGKDGSTWKDEDGLNLKITKSTPGGNTVYTMTDQDAENTWIFHNGYLTEHTDDNGNAVYIAYNGNDYNTSSVNWKPAGGQAARITQIAEKTNAGSSTQIRSVASFSYNDSNYLTGITDYAGRTTTFQYTDDRLATITYPDGTHAEYRYDPSGTMNTAYDSESKYGIAFTWWGENAPDMGYTCNIRQIKEFTAGSVNGNKNTGNAYHMYRNSNQLTSGRFYGADQVSDTEDDLVVYNVFDYYGRTITSYTTDWQKETVLGVSAGAYHPNSSSRPDTNNRLSKSAVSGQHVENLLLNSGMEQTGNGIPSWTKVASTSDTGMANAVVGQAIPYDAGYNSSAIKPHTGKYALRTYLSRHLGEGSGYSHLKQTVSLTGGKEYTFSAYVNTSALNNGQNFSDSTKGVYLAFCSTSGTTLKKSDVISYYTEPMVEDGWERLSVTFRPGSSGNYDLTVCQDGVAGIAVFDDIQLETGDTMSKVNLLQDAGFENAGTYWSGGNLQTESSSVLPAHGNTLKMTGTLSTDVEISQTVPVNLPSDNTFLLSGWGKANSVFFAAKDDHSTYDRFFGLIAEVKYEATGELEYQYVPFSPLSSDWQYVSGVVAPKKSGEQVESIRVICAYNRNANTAYFEGVSLIHEPADTYTYDDKGNPVAANTEKAKTSCEYYEGTSRIKKYTTPSGTSHTLTYERNTGNVASETLDNVTTSMTYNSSGGQTSTRTQKSDGTGPYLLNSTGYDAAQEHAVSFTDANGTTRTDGYNDRHLKISSTTGDLPTQYWIYEASNDRLNQTYRQNLHSSFYGYTNGMPDTFTRKSYLQVGNTGTPVWQRYTMQYDSFGNNTSVGVSSSTNGSSYSTVKKLASFVYESTVNNSSVSNGRLSRTIYPDGDSVSYDYDRFDNICRETYSDDTEDHTTYHYLYDSEGALSEKYAENGDNQTERYNYDYDSLGRLIHSRKTDGSGQLLQRTEHLYDTSDRLTAQNWVTGRDLAVSQQYSYNQNDDTLAGIASTVKTGIGTSSFSERVLPAISYTYNAIRQLTRRTTGSNFYQAFSYHSRSSENRTTTQVEYMNYRKANNDLIKGYRYEYDSSGRISSVYSSLASGWASSTAEQEYSYDQIGQLSSVSDNSIHHTYSYSYDTAGNIRQMVDAADGGDTVRKTLGYTDEVWADRLTSVKIGDGDSVNIEYEPDNNGYISGNPKKYFNGTHYSFNWQKGRQLKTAETGSLLTGNRIRTEYTYDMSGVRSSKKVNDTEYHFDTLSGQVMHQEWGNRHLYFLYDDSNQPYALLYRNGNNAPVLYYYLLNIQGDVVGLMDENQQIQALYHYDPWGAVTVLSADGSTDTSSNSIGMINPLRYRGYYYDSETGFYYLETRYYDPALGRFLNADTYSTTDTEGFLSYNMFAYCENDPVNCADKSGEIAHVIVGAVIGAVANAGATFISETVSFSKTGNILEFEKPDRSVWLKVAGAAVIGAFDGGVCALAPTIAPTIHTGMAVTQALWDASVEGSISNKKLAFNIAFAAATGGLSKVGFNKGDAKMYYQGIRQCGKNFKNSKRRNGVFNTCFRKTSKIKGEIGKNSFKSIVKFRKSLKKSTKRSVKEFALGLFHGSLYGFVNNHINKKLCGRNK